MVSKSQGVHFQAFGQVAYDLWQDLYGTPEQHLKTCTTDWRLHEGGDCLTSPSPMPREGPGNLACQAPGMNEPVNEPVSE